MWARTAWIGWVMLMVGAGCEFPTGRSFVAFDRMALNGVRSQQTLWDMYFEPDGDALNAQGRQRLCWIRAHLDPRDPRIYVQALPGKDEQTHARVQAVTREMGGSPAGQRVAAVLPSSCTTVHLLPGETLTQVVVPGDAVGGTGINLPRAGAGGKAPTSGASSGRDGSGDGKDGARGGLMDAVKESK